MQRFRNEFDIVDAKINSLHASRSNAEANRHLSFFFPEERLLVILKPNLIDQQRCKIFSSRFFFRFFCFVFSAEIHQAFRKAEFFILAHKNERLTAEQATQVFSAHQGKDYFDDLISYMMR